MIKNIKSETGFSGFYIVFDGSTMNERPGWYGLSHLLEHLICKSFKHLQDTFQEKNIKWNASTGTDEVVFFMTGLDRHINQHKKEFLELILNYEPTQKELDNEKNIVLEEYKMSFNNQQDSHYLNLHRKLFGYYNAIGLRSDIENFTLQDCKDYLNLYYKKPTNIVNISKYNDFEYDLEFREKTKVEPFQIKSLSNFFTIKSDDKTDVPEGMIPLEIINTYKNKVSVINLSPVINENFAYISFTCEMLGSGLNSPLYKEIREKLGLVYSISCLNDRLNSKSSMFVIATDTSKKNVNKIQKEIKNILENKEKFLTQERFDIIKESYKTKIEEANILNYKNFKRYIEEPEWLIENIIDKITLSDVYNIVDQYLTWDKIYKSVDKNEF